MMCLVLVVLGTGCATDLDPLQESALYFSINGYLDASADTQFVRISPVRDRLLVDPGPLDATVVLEHLATGRQSVWRDSLFHYSNGLWAHNFWSAEPLTPGASYRLTVTRSDGATSTAAVTLPAAFPDPTIVAHDPGNPPNVRIRGVERLADVQMRYRVRSLYSGREVVVEKSYLEEVSRMWFMQEDSLWHGHVVFIRTYEDEADLRLAVGPFEIVSRETRVAAAGPQWPDLAGVDPETQVLPEGASNVEHGTGFLGGITSKTVPW